MGNRSAAEMDEVKGKGEGHFMLSLTKGIAFPPHFAVDKVAAE
jgi:hypothetical protein